MLIASSDRGASEEPVHGKLIGTEIVLAAGRTILRGRVNGNAIEGTARENGQDRP